MPGLVRFGIDQQVSYPDPPLVGRTVVLRPFRPEDFDVAAAADPDPVSARWVPSMPADDGPGVAAYYEDCRRDGVLLHLVIVDRIADGYLGEVMVAFGEHQVGEVGCLVHPDARGQGVAVEAFGLLTDWALGPLGLARLQVFVATDNVGGLRLSERTGFRREGVLRSYGENAEGRFDAILLSRLAGEPQGGAL